MVALLDVPCPQCGVPSGDHTMRAWLEHSRVDLPFEPVDPVVQFDFGDRQWTIADNFYVRALVVVGDVAGGVSVELPMLLLTFFVSGSGADGASSVRQVAEIGYVADAIGLRRFGTLIRDAAFGAAKRAVL